MATKQSPPEQLEADLVEKLLINEYETASWLTATEDFQQSNMAHDVCNIKMAHGWPTDHDVLITYIKSPKPLDLAYTNWLISGPFRGMSDKVSIIKHPTGKYYLKCTDLAKWPSKVLYNLCIASRMPWEHEQYLERWELFTKAGIDPSLSFLLSVNSITYDPPEKPWEWKVKTPNYGVGNSNHHWFDAHTNWRRVMEGDLNADFTPAHSFKNNPDDCRPTNCIWSVEYDELNPQDQFKEVLGKDVNQLYELFGLTKTVEPKPKKAIKVAVEELKMMLEPNPVVQVLNPAGQVMKWDDHLHMWVIDPHQPLPELHFAEPDGDNDELDAFFNGDDEDDDPEDDF